MKLQLIIIRSTYTPITTSLKGAKVVWLLKCTVGKNQGEGLGSTDALISNQYQKDLTHPRSPNDPLEPRLQQFLDYVQ